MPQSKRPYHHGNLREALIASCLQLIEEKGVKALNMREIAAASGVSRMAPYRHFADKAALLMAIREAGFVQFGAALEHAKATAEAGVRAQLSAMALAYVRFAAAHRAHFEVMFNQTLDGPASEAGERAFGILEQTIREGQNTGELCDGDSVLLARAVWAQVHGISMLRLEPDLSDGGEGTRFVRFCVALLERGLVRSEEKVPATPAGVAPFSSGIRN